MFHEENSSPAFEPECFVNEILYAFFRRLHPLLLCNFADNPVLPHRLPPICIAKLRSRFDAELNRRDVGEPS